MHADLKRFFALFAILLISWNTLTASYSAAADTSIFSYIQALTASPFLLVLNAFAHGESAELWGRRQRTVRLLYCVAVWLPLPVTLAVVNGQGVLPIVICFLSNGIGALMLAAAYYDSKPTHGSI